MSSGQSRRRRRRIKFTVDDVFRTPPHKPYRLIPWISDRKLVTLGLTVACTLVGLTIYDMRQKGKMAAQEKRARELRALQDRLNMNQSNG